MSLEHFDELNNDLANYLPTIHAGHQWQMIRMYFGDMKRVREERRRREEQEREVMAAVRRCLEF